MSGDGGESSGSGGDDDHVSEWELGLPASDDLAPLSQRLISPELASAFSISPEPYRTTADVHRASQVTLSVIRGQLEPEAKPSDFKLLERDEDGLDLRKIGRTDDGLVEDADSADDASKTLKRPRLVWTPQLHKRFVEVVDHLGIKNAVPKTIMHLMNVEGLTRENVASHLQKYRLYVKRMQGPSHEGLSLSEQSFASTPLPQSLNEPRGDGHGAMPVPIPMPYPTMHVPMMLGSHGDYPWMQQKKEASGNHNFGSVGYNAGSNDK